MNIVLIGYRCSGKTTTGELLSKRLGLPFVDTDFLMEVETGRCLSGIISAYGWERFRDLEARIITRVTDKDGIVIATGGGAVLREDNLARLESNGWIVWLSAGVETLTRRMRLDMRKGRQRPPLQSMDAVEEARDILLERLPFYTSAADLRVDTDGLEAARVVDRILEAMPAGQWDRGSDTRGQAHAG